MNEPVQFDETLLRPAQQCADQAILGAFAQSKVSIPSLSDYEEHVSTAAGNGNRPKAETDVTQHCLNTAKTEVNLCLQHLQEGKPYSPAYALERVAKYLRPPVAPDTVQGYIHRLCQEGITAAVGYLGTQGINLEFSTPSSMQQL